MSTRNEVSNGNVRLVHEEAIKPECMYNKKPLHWYVGRCVKIAFQSAKSPVEHMWVRITDVDENDLIGVLDNYPVSVIHLRYGDRVTLNRTQIEAVDLSLDEWCEELDMLNAEGDYRNKKSELPQADDLEWAYHEGLTPRQALKRWRDCGSICGCQ